MRFSFFLALAIMSISAKADILFFSGSIAEGTESFSNVKSTEFILDAGADQLRFCGFLQNNNGTKEKFERKWILLGSRVFNNAQKELGSYYGGNLLLEEPVTNSRGATEFLAYEINRQGPTYFTFDFHDPSRGFVNADGWLQKDASATLKSLCQK